VNNDPRADRIYALAATLQANALAAQLRREIDWWDHTETAIRTIEQATKVTP
jgi:hypothetical protein